MAIQGTVMKLVRDKGFGFIRGNDGREYFMHRTAIADFEAVQEGVVVEFDPEQSPKGPRAEKVSLVL